MGEQADGDLHHVLESPYMASKVHEYVPGHYVPEEMICPLLYGIGIGFKSVTFIYLR